VIVVTFVLGSLESVDGGDAQGGRREGFAREDLWRDQEKLKTFRRRLEKMH